MSLAVAAPRLASLRLSDGVRLDADLWAPEGGGRYPVLLMRQPYGRRIASTIVYAHPAWYAAQGYVVVIQDVRGTGTSEGEFRSFLHEERDGAESVAWARDLPESDGRLGMYGFSYQGNSQLLALAGGARPEALAPAMIGWDLRDDWAYEGEAMAHAQGIGWACQMGWIKAMHDGAFDVARGFQTAQRNPPLGEARRCLPAILRDQAAWTHYDDWLGDDPTYWASIAPRARLAAHPLDVPMLHVGGWYDQMLMGTLGGHAAAMARGGAEQRLVIGPWTHLPWGRRVGAVDFGESASSPVDTMQLAWFDRHLKGREGPKPAALTLFDLGAKAWRDFDAWPAVTETPLYLGGSGRAAATVTDGMLRAEAGAAGVEWFVHDPWRPVPALGGHLAQPGGMQDRAGIDDRADVAVFTSAPLAKPLALCGLVSAELFIEADQPGFDISATLAMVAPDGRAFNLTQGFVRRGAGGAVTLGMRAVFATVPAGHALRLSLAGACFPAFAVNPGTGARPADWRAEDERIISLALRHGGATPSHILLPVMR